ncbi:unnamed protein product [Diplocarpon coronariae]
MFGILGSWVWDKLRSAAAAPWKVVLQELLQTSAMVGEGFPSVLRPPLERRCHPPREHRFAHFFARGLDMMHRSSSGLTTCFGGGKSSSPESSLTPEPALQTKAANGWVELQLDPPGTSQFFPTGASAATPLSHEMLEPSPSLSMPRVWLSLCGAFFALLALLAAYRGTEVRGQRSEVRPEGFSQSQARIIRDGQFWSKQTGAECLWRPNRPDSYNSSRPAFGALGGLHRLMWPAEE